MANHPATHQAPIPSTCLLSLGYQVENTKKKLFLCIYETKFKPVIVQSGKWKRNAELKVTVQGSFPGLS